MGDMGMWGDGDMKTLTDGEMGTWGHKDIGKQGDRETWGHRECWGTGTLGTLGTKPLCVRTHRTLAPGCDNTWGTMALVLGCGGIWGSGASAPRHRDVLGPMSHGGCRALGLAGPCHGDMGAVLNSAIRWGAPGTNEGSPALSVPQSLCPPPIPLPYPWENGSGATRHPLGWHEWDSRVGQCRAAPSTG